MTHRTKLFTVLLCIVPSACPNLNIHHTRDHFSFHTYVDKPSFNVLNLTTNLDTKCTRIYKCRVGTINDLGQEINSIQVFHMSRDKSEMCANKKTSNAIQIWIFMGGSDDRWSQAV